MTPGKKYRIRFRRMNDRSRWEEVEMVGVYLGNDYAGRAMLDLRPYAGTQYVERDVIVHTIQVHSSASLRLPTVVVGMVD
jgi:hypothetical protein